MSQPNPFRIGDVVSLRDTDYLVGLVKEISDKYCAVCWYNRERGSYSGAKWVPWGDLTLSTV